MDWEHLFYQAWQALRNVIYFSPVISIGLSMLILIFAMKMLALNQEQKRIHEKIFSILISGYIVTIVWGWSYVGCFIFVTSGQMLKHEGTGFNESVQVEASPDRTASTKLKHDQISGDLSSPPNHHG
jgi:hypothetical protein